MTALASPATNGLITSSKSSAECCPSESMLTIYFGLNLEAASKPVWVATPSEGETALNATVAVVGAPVTPPAGPLSAAIV